MRSLFLLLLTCLGLTALAQNKKPKQPAADQLFNSIAEKDTLKNIEREIRSGNKQALVKLAAFLDSTKEITEFLGYHILKTPKRDIAWRLIHENFLFIGDGFSRDSIVNSQAFLEFYKKNEAAIHFSKETGYYSLTAFDKRKTEYELREIDDTAFISFRKKLTDQLGYYWVKENKIDSFIKAKDPYCLYLIAAIFVKNRSRFDNYDLSEEHYIDLVTTLTHSEIAVPDEKELSFMYNSFDPTQRINLFIYFANHYKDYQWNDTLNYFVNTVDRPARKDIGVILFERLSSQNDTAALDAFQQLSESDPVKVGKLTALYDKQYRSTNFSLPSFTYRTVNVLANLSSYCRAHNIRYKLDDLRLKQLDSLGTWLDFSQLYAIENRIIANTTLDQITSIEYYTLMKRSPAARSMGRIIDKLYSKYWKQIIADKDQLATYLWKAALFKTLGIVGINGKYTYRFDHSGSFAADQLRALQQFNTDTKIISELPKAIELCMRVPTDTLPQIFYGFIEEDMKKTVDNYTTAYRAITKKSFKDKYDRNNALEKLSGKIRYHQIGEALRLLLRDSSFEVYSKYHFLESDFGFIINLLDTSSVRNFYKQYLRLNEMELYKWTVAQWGPFIFNNNGSLNYKEVYEVLKHDLDKTFAGSDYGRDENVYSLIKVLELTHKTTLGFYPKLCSWSGIWSREYYDQAMYWMQYIRKNKLYVPEDTDPVSIVWYH